MNNPKISWRVLEEIAPEEFEFVQHKSYTEEGSFVPGDYIQQTIQVWNNFLGTESVLDAESCNLIIAFKKFEDNFLLNLIEIQIDDTVLDIEIDIDKGVVPIGTLSGAANNGSSLNTDNYKTIHLSIGPIPENIKSELKSMYFYLEHR